MKRYLREGRLLVPRWGVRSVAIEEIGTSGFGDRLRGVALGLALCRCHRVRTLLYNDTEGPFDPERRWRAFPFKMTELVDLEGIDFRATALPLPKESVQVTHNSRYGTSLKRLGFRMFHRLKPRNPEIDAQLDEIGVDESYLGFHVRGTDAKGTDRYDAGVEALRSRALDELWLRSMEFKTKRVFLAADNGPDREMWRRELRDLGYQVLCNEGVTWRTDEFRQTGAEDMLVDFFGLSRTARVVRFAASEFSRYAAWRRGQWMQKQAEFEGLQPSDPETTPIAQAA